MENRGCDTASNSGSSVLQGSLPNAICPMWSQDLWKKMWHLCLRSRRWQQNWSMKTLMKQPHASLYAANTLCVLEEDWKKFVGFLREKCAGKRSPKSPKPSMDETTSSSYPQSHGQAWGPVLALDWSHSGRGDPTLREYERHWRRGENK